MKEWTYTVSRAFQVRDDARVSALARDIDALIARDYPDLIEVQTVKRPMENFLAEMGSALRSNVKVWVETFESPRANKLATFNDVYIAACALLDREPKEL